MAVIIKSEWHQVEKRYSLEITLDDVMAVYDLEEDEAQEIYNQIVSGEYDIEQFMDDARENDIWFDFDWMDEDDWWTDRKGGYEVTYEVIEEESFDDVEVDDDLTKKLEELKAEFDRILAGEPVDCFSCGELVKDSELIDLNGQYHCPHCHEGWVEPENRGEE
jgi:predicted Zn-ribbon and HTH transcriptional regulator